MIRGLADQLVMDLLHECETSPTGMTNALDHSALYIFKVICTLTFSKVFAVSETEDVQRLLDAMNDSLFAFAVDKFFRGSSPAGWLTSSPGPWVRAAATMTTRPKRHIKTTTGRNSLIPYTDNIFVLINNSYLKAIITGTLQLYPSIVLNLLQVMLDLL